MDYYSSLDPRSLNSTPTLFEIISSDELSGLLSPSLRYILVHYAQKYPRHLLPLALKFDEINLVLRGALEWYFLSKWNATFTDKFYGLKRASKVNVEVHNQDQIFSLIEPQRRLSRVQVLGSLVNLVGARYVQEKLDVYFEQLKAKFVLRQLKVVDWKSWFKVYFVKLYPGIKKALRLMNLLCQIMYLSGRTKSSSLTDWLLKIEHARITQFDHDWNEGPKKQPEVTIQRNKPASFGQQIMLTSGRYYEPLQTAVSQVSATAFPLAIFMLKFLEWWNSSEFASKLSNQRLDKDIPPPAKGPEFPLQNSEKCPLCQEEITNHAIIETGYVFCYPCITRHLAEGSSKHGGRCPVSGQRLLGCRYDYALKEWKVDGIRRLVI